MGMQFGLNDEAEHFDISGDVWTIHCSVKWDTPTFGDGAFSGRATGNGSFYYILQCNNSGLIEIATPNNSRSGTTIVAGTFYEVTVTRSGDTWQLFVDGVQQGGDMTQVMAGIDVHLLGNALTFGDFGLDGVVDGLKVWNSVLTPAEILAEVGTEAAVLQTGLVTEANLNDGARTTAQTGTNLVETGTVTDGGENFVAGPSNLNLTAPTNMTFDPLASIHIQWMGTGILNWTNNSTSKATIGSTPNGGTINFINPAVFTINGIINGAEVRLYDNELVEAGNNGTELAGTETNSGTTFIYNHSGTTNNIIVQMIATGYEEVKSTFTLVSSDQLLTLFPKIEENT